MLRGPVSFFVGVLRSNDLPCWMRGSRRESPCGEPIRRKRARPGCSRVSLNGEVECPRNHTLVQVLRARLSGESDVGRLMIAQANANLHVVAREIARAPLHLENPSMAPAVRIAS